MGEGTGAIVVGDGVGAVVVTTGELIPNETRSEVLSSDLLLPFGTEAWKLELELDPLASAVTDIIATLLDDDEPIPDALEGTVITLLDDDESTPEELQDFDSAAGDAS